MLRVVIVIIASVSILTAAVVLKGCSGGSPNSIKRGMSLESAMQVLKRESLEPKETTGAQMYQSYQISSPESDDALVFTVDTGRLRDIYWLRNWRVDAALPKAKRKDDRAYVDTIAPEEIRRRLK